MTGYRVRFASPSKTYNNHVGCQSAVGTDVQDATDKLQARQRSRSGCRECRQRRVKCDETLPVCQRCQRRATVCHPSMFTSQWRFEMPWLACSPVETVLSVPNPDIKVDGRLMRYWLDATSQMLSVDPSNNPFSFPILKYVTDSASLVHFIQSASAAHEEYFHQPKLPVSLSERGKAFSALRQELQNKNSSLSHSFLTLLMLGMSSSWMSLGPTHYRREHLIVARVVVDMILQKDYSRLDELDHLTMGLYVYWDMACSFYIDPAYHPTDRAALLQMYMKQGRHRFHAITTHSIDLYYLLGQLGRYCRVIVEGGARDLVFESSVEGNLNEYISIETERSAQALTKAFRKHDLLLLSLLWETGGLSAQRFYYHGNRKLWTPARTRYR
ncbi:Zn(II)2Cys6 transcription factor [Aspergillus affinis]|uniref:Zn(II)2Cys6 transcription factor n=1 Tax=Aspergillus affinis TaxID=1070780 RepID=UPI0022FE1138|nr:fungal-specific transcription factor domain-containing protein [Aspergillus affinis]KAI9035324.1 fungal-specific transcription factor domain-containing protein [Aspergillus affinis]